MSLRNDVDGYLGALGDKLGIGRGHLSPAGEALIRSQYEGVVLDVTIVVLEEQQTVSLAASVGRIPGDSETAASAIAGLLAANVLGVATQGLAFSYSPKDQQIYLGYSLISPSQGYPTFEAAFTRLLVLGSHWKRLLSADARPGSSP